jgi:hypothetical protein
MSHFTVLVIGGDVDEQLAPFQENNMGDCPRQYLEFQDQEDEYRDSFENESRKMVRLKDGSLVPTYDDMFRVQGHGVMSDGPSHVVPDDLEQIKVPFKELYADFETYVKEYHGHEERDPETGRYGYWENPNRKWDWYQVGGRWSGFFKLKPGAKGALGERGVLGNVPSPGHADQVTKGDVDWNAMRDDAEREARTHWNRMNDVIAGRPFRAWDEVTREMKGRPVEEMRTMYHSQPVIGDLQKAGLLGFMADGLAEFREGVDAAARRARNSVGVPFAILKDGQWYERGRMGWFGTSSDEMSQDEWNAKFAELIDGLSDDTPLTLVDCHI